MSASRSLFYTIPLERTRPFLASLESFRIRYLRRLTGWGRGPHVSPRAGSGTEFREFRDYAQGDDVRFLDWKTTARFARPFVRTFQHEENRFVHFLIDASHSMVLNPADRKLDYARDLALALGYLALGSDDPVAFSVLTSRSASRTRAACAHRGRISSIRDFLDTAPGGGVADLPAAAARVVGENPGRQGTAVILSDFLYAEEEFRSALRLLLGHGIQVAAIHILGPSEWDLPAGKDDLVEVRDVETGRTRLIAIREDTLRLYRQSIAAHERRLRAFAFGLRAWYALFDPRARDGAAYLETFTRRHLPGMGLIRGKI